LIWNRARDTPTVRRLDALGRIIGETRNNAGGGAAPTDADLLTTTLGYDLAGNLLSVVDARGFVSMQGSYDRQGNLVREQSPDSGAVVTLHAADGQPCAQWTANGFGVQRTYDALRRPVATGVNPPPTGGGQPFVAERVVYGEDFALDDAVAHNARGQAVLRYHGAGLDQNWHYDFDGRLVTQRTWVLPAASTGKPAPDWSGLAFEQAPLAWATPPGAGQLAEPYVTSFAYDALDRVTQTTTADGTVTTRSYNLRGQLAAVTLTPPDKAAQAVVKSVTYNARGQRHAMQYGNGTKTAYAYDPLTFRLDSQRTTGPTGAAVQFLVFTHDAAGNVTARRDLAQPTIYFGNAASPPVATYTYDALYRLVAATGRESALASETAPPFVLDPGPLQVKSPLSDQQVRPYRQAYQYDKVGNLLRMTHIPGTPSTPGWGRTYAYEAGSSRLLSTAVGDNAGSYLHDAAGNLVAMPHLNGGQPGGLGWDWAGRLASTGLTAQQAAYYDYTADGQRRQKVAGFVLGGGGFQVQRRVVYLPGGLEIVEKLDANAGVVAAWQTVAVDDGQSCLLRAETQTAGVLPNVQFPVLRYQVQDQVGSVAIELTGEGDVLGVEEFYPYGDTAYWSQAGAAGFSRKRYRFNGKEKDEESGLYYYGARYYAASLGRWTACDPAPAVGVSPFEFCSGNPGSKVDPDGREADWIDVPAPDKRVQAAQQQFGMGIVRGLFDLGVASVKGAAATISPVAAAFRTVNTVNEMTTAYREGGGGFSGLIAAVNVVNPVAQVAESAFRAWYAPTLESRAYHATQAAVQGTAVVAGAAAVAKLAVGAKAPRVGDVPPTTGGGGSAGNAVDLAAGEAVASKGAGFRSFDAFKRAQGPAGPGMHWHHVVEQTPGNLGRFGAETVHNTGNLVRVDAATHGRISAYYSSKQRFTGDMTVREWLSTKSFQEQAEFGAQTMRKFGVGQ